MVNEITESEEKNEEDLKTTVLEDNGDIEEL